MLRETMAASVAAAIALAVGPTPLRADQGDPRLDYGPHGVGFTVIEALDSTRAFRPLRDHRGRLADETARPVQIGVWYPATAPDDGRRMPAGEFRSLTASEVDFDVVVTAAEEARLRAVFIEQATSFGAERADAARVWDEPTPAVRDAAPMPGPYPTVLYFTAAGVGNPLLPAYLASHGFVVATFPSNGRMTEGSLEFTPNALTLETDVDDAGFVHAVLRRLPYADTDRLAVTSFSGGSLAALLWVMRDMQASAVVAVEGWERYRRGADIVTASVHYDPHRVRVPFLMIERAADETSPRYAKVPDVVEALPYTDITRVAFRDAAHGDFLSHVPFGHSAAQPQIYAASTRMVRRFLEAHLGEDDEAAADLAALAPPPDDPFFTVARDTAIGPVPTEEELYRLAETDPDAAAAAYRDAIRTVPGHQLFREAVLTRATVFADDAAHRAAIMAIVVDAYPLSTAARFGLAEAMSDAGREDAAVEAYRAALAAVEGDPELDDAQRAEWRQRIEAALAGSSR